MSCLDTARKLTGRRHSRRPLPAILTLVVMCSTSACGSGDTTTSSPQTGTARSGGGSSFTDIAEQAGLGDFRHETGAFGKRWFPESMGSGGGFVDFNGDGWYDIVLAGGGNWPEQSGGEEDPVRALYLYRNNADGTFSNVTEEAGLGGLDAYTIGLTAADYDNDGDQDIYVTALHDNLLLENTDGTFTERAAAAGIAGPGEWSTSAIFFDADRDGYVDLYVGNYVDWSPENDLVCVLEGQIRSYCTPELYVGTPSRFYHNNGDGTFTDWTERAGFASAPGKTLGVAEYDVNRDGWPDLLVANDTQRDLFYLNDGDGTFTEQGALSGMAYDENGKARAGMGIDVGVVDRTGEPTLFVGNFSKEMISVYRYIGNGLFIDRAALSQIGRPSLLTLTFGLFLFDADLDGDLDLFAANGHVQPEIEQTQEGIAYSQRPHLFVNDGDGTFDDVALQWGGALEQAVVARGAAYADVDLDGDLDVLITENSGPAHLLRNELSDGRVLRVGLEGVTSNRDGLSSRVILYAGDRRLERQVRTGSSMLSVSEKESTFGLGLSENVDSLVVFWPSGRVDRHQDLRAGSDVRVREGEAAPIVRPLSGRRKSMGV